MKYRIATKKKQLERFARAKFKQYSMDKWRIQFIEGNSHCSYAYCEPAWRTISLYTSTLAEHKLPTLKDTFLHELAHGIVGVKKPFHGKEFQKACKEIGCKGFRAKNHLEVFDMFGRFIVTEKEEYETLKSTKEQAKIINSGKK
ncbi:MAG TPA: SprT-like domain-containing protein [Ignavibacteria bacterium]